jgi:glycosyltransferase involved in cell wall biosynthesis
MHSSKLPVSVNLVIRNEEERLRLLLPILHEYFDEIVVIDQESTDLSRSICLTYTDKVFTDVATGYPESSRALAASLSKNDWVVIIDADEIPNARLLSDLPNILNDDVDCILFHYGVFEFTDEIADYNEITNFMIDTDKLKIRIAPMMCRIIKTSHLICNEFLHEGIEIKHGSRCHYLKYHGLFHHKTNSRQTRVKERYGAVMGGTYDKETHL